MYRHGDLLIVSAKLPGGLRPRPSGILAEGEVTGHAHRLSGGTVLEDPQGLVYLRITEDGAVVTHEEHGPIALPSGTYQVVRQRQYDPYEQAARQVAD